MGLFGDFEKLNSGPVEVLAMNGSSLAGVGIDPEGIDNNPAYLLWLIWSIARGLQFAHGFGQFMTCRLTGAGTTASF